MGERGRFIVLDGIDGCGKSTQAVRLVAALAAGGRRPPLHLREPGSTALGEELRELVLSRDLHLGPEVEALIMVAARRQMLDELVRPALEEGRDVVCERFHPSTYAYQAVAGGANEKQVLSLLEEWAGEPKPDLVVVLEVDVEAAARRRAGPADRIEDKGLAYQRKVAAGFLRYVERDRAAVVVDGSLDPDEVARRVLAEVHGAR